MMHDDVKTLVEPAQEWDARAVQRNPEKAARYIQALAAALEAVAPAPIKTVQEVLELLDAFHGDSRMSYDAYTNLHDAVALLEVRPTLAVDREALAERLFYIDGRDDWGVANEDERKEYLERAGTVMWLCEARDVRDVQAEALERYADDRWGTVGKHRKEENSMFDEELRIRERAQAIREARSER